MLAFRRIKGRVIPILKQGAKDISNIKHAGKSLKKIESKKFSYAAKDAKMQIDFYKSRSTLTPKSLKTKVNKMQKNYNEYKKTNELGEKVKSGRRGVLLGGGLIGSSIALKKYFNKGK